MSERVATRLKEKGFIDVRNPDEIRERFVEIARLIMCSHELVCGDRRWQITALELYLSTASDVWRDPYTHRNPEQLESGTWYVHADGNRAPNYSGIDITCGSKDGTHGGLLIRELSKEQRWVFQRIVRGNHPSFPRKGNKWSDEEKRLIKTGIHRRRIDSDALKIVQTSERKEALWIGPRIGLNSKPGSEPFRLAPLRVATWRTAKPHFMKNFDED